MEAPIEHVYLTKVETAAYLRVSLRTIDSLISKGLLQAYRPLCQQLIRRTDIDAFVERYPEPVQQGQAVNEKDAS